MELTLGKEQIYTSKRMLKYPALGKLFSHVFGYTNIGNYARFSIFKNLVKSLPVHQFKRVMDLGCGYGEYAIGLAKSYPNLKVHALDIDEKRIDTVEYAVRKAQLTNITTHTSKIQNNQEGNFDLIYSVDVFEHILPEEMPFNSCFGRLRPGGYLLVKIPNIEQKTIFPSRLFEEHQTWLDDEHVGQVYDLQGLENRFLDAGFEIQHASYSDGYLSRLAWEIAYLGKKMGIIGQALTIHLSKSLIYLDRKFHNGKWGNAIQVLGKKPD